MSERPTPFAHGMVRCRGAALLVVTLSLPPFAVAQAPPVAGLAARDALTRAYDAILNADFDAVAAPLANACSSVPVWCEVLAAVSLWWQIALDPEDTERDAPFRGASEEAISAAEEWTTREPQRAEAWLALGAAIGARAQWRVLRGERLAAARDGKRIKESLEQAITLDLALDDAKFGIGMYRYYAALGPSSLRVLRWLLLLPGGDRQEGLRLMEDARRDGDIAPGEASYQLHLVYLWYENRPHDALSLIVALQQRYPRNPLFALIEAQIHDVYFHDVQRSEDVLRRLIARAVAGDVNEADVAVRRARTLLRTLQTRGKP